ncbi:MULTISPECIES: 16S rRNA (cytosine(1402)-N(4))-methyltransferase RsmH [unclassified Wenzhouxiangella]|uniref:16S rRNA (cytosine(1402)-N(4))-methyltransferase RsmH n=1 Tax=unclassified Wenzhouxiangella TaxID=2613841 RepID=UPI000E32889F|nr:MULTISPECIES: 16S rRNA (cytosine(1402)-N(4))-methyltransferase RsmH [unclassified Wenzhouxiangella]RFF28737.1 16S rRNA (cytosine(1402)-N(4))-methyltransferase RsmH [Wenzhouxiangella sp. 15181]RFP67860.1 16S rRNA (cytosine(1402)-N(4))-methyltransferase RsmH [Wenzhouxiangella sp. 15190]
MATDQEHVPVLEGPALDALRIRADGVYVDGTYGRGGHSAAMLARLGEDGRLVVTDRDPQAIADARAKYDDDGRVTIRRANFAEIGSIVDALGLTGRVDGLLLDIGVSSPQLDDPERGFSFQHDGPLDMRMDPDSGESAAEWLARADESEIARVIKEFGEERFGRRIARAIVQARETAPIERTAQLAAIVSDAVPGPPSPRHPATRTFQALRIFINDELGALERALDEGIELLAPGGRFVVISFHSLEDRLVKRRFAKAAKPPPASRRLPATEAFVPRLKLIDGLIQADENEMALNRRSRSARMRAAEKTAGEAA